MDEPTPNRCECTPETLCAFHEARGADPAESATFAEQRWQAHQEFH